MYIYLLISILLILCLYYLTLEQNIIILLSISIIILLTNLFNKNNYEKFRDITYFENINKLLLDYFKQKQNINNEIQNSQYKSIYLSNSKYYDPDVSYPTPLAENTINYNSKEIKKKDMYHILKNFKNN